MDLTKLLYVNSDGLMEEGKSTDSAKFASFKTDSYELTDTLLGKLVNAVNASAGAGDAGKFILLDAGGKVDGSMIDSGDVSHDSTDGVAASTAHTAFPLLAGGRQFTAIQRYDSAKTYSNDYEIVDKKYVDDVAASLGTQAEWQDSCIDQTATPPGTPSTGDRYLVGSGASGGWSGHDDEIAEWDGSAWQFTVPSTGTYTSLDDESDGLYYYSGSAWVKKYYEATTASLGCKKSGVDIQADLLANGGIALDSNSLYVQTDDSSIEKDGSGNLQVKEDGINDTHIDFGTGANQVSAVDLPIADAGGYTSETEVEGAIQELYGEVQNITVLEETAGAGGVSKGDMVYYSANDTVLPYSTLANPEAVIGIALETKAAGETVRIAQGGKTVTGVLSSATAGNRYYWNGSGWQTSIPTTSGAHVWLGFVAKNATDAITFVEFIKKNA